MNLSLPSPASVEWSTVPPETIVLFYLSCSRRSVSRTVLIKNLHRWLDVSQIDKALATLEKDGRFADGQMTENGKAIAAKCLGRDAGKEWKVILSGRLPLMALGLDPDDAQVAKRFSSADALMAAVIATAFGLGKPAHASKNSVCNEIVWRILRAALPNTVGSPPYPAIEKFGPVERVLISGLAKTTAKSVTAAYAALASACIGCAPLKAEDFRKELVALVSRRDVGKSGESPAVDHDESFADRVKNLAVSMSTPPFKGRVAIAQVYDAFGREHADAGSIASFKERLVTDARRQLITLGRLDLPERLDRDLRLRSETQWDSDIVHFVVTEWK